VLCSLFHVCHFEALPRNPLCIILMDFSHSFEMTGTFLHISFNNFSISCNLSIASLISGKQVFISSSTVCSSFARNKSCERYQILTQLAISIIQNPDSSFHINIFKRVDFQLPFFHIKATSSPKRSCKFASSKRIVFQICLSK